MSLCATLQAIRLIADAKELIRSPVAASAKTIAARKAGITGQIGFHTLRRTLASALVAKGNDIRLVQELLRHSNHRMTLDAYARSTTPAKIEAQGWVMRQLLTEDSKAALAASKPASTRAM